MFLKSNGIKSLNSYSEKLQQVLYNLDTLHYNVAKVIIIIYQNYIQNTYTLIIER